MQHEKNETKLLLSEFRKLNLDKKEIEDIFQNNKDKLDIQLQAFVNQIMGISKLSYDVGKILEQKTKNKTK